VPNRIAARRWRFASVLLIVGIVLGAIAYNRGNSPRPAPTINDQGFVAAANRLCLKTLPGLRATRIPVKSEDDREAETAAAIDSASSGVDALVVRLRSLEVTSAAAAEVDAWLEQWGAYTAAGRRYAAAIRRGDPREYGRVDDESVAPLNAISRFSRGNRIDACIP